VPAPRHGAGGGCTWADATLAPTTSAHRTAFLFEVRIALPSFADQMMGVSILLPRERELRTAR